MNAKFDDLVRSLDPQTLEELRADPRVANITAAFRQAAGSDQ